MKGDGPLPTSPMAAPVEDDPSDFLAYMEEAHRTDLSAIERCGCLSFGRDMKNHPLIIMIPSMAIHLTTTSSSSSSSSSSSTGNASNNNAQVTVFRKMLLYFLRQANTMVGTPYSVVYAHTTYDLLSQYPLIYRFYSILPRSYKKNIQKMYIIHPNVGIRMFFEFARIFLSQKFYQKLMLFETILDFQRHLPPTLVPLPCKFIRKEDEERGIKYGHKLAPIEKMFDPILGTTRCLDICTNYLRGKKALQEMGIFRIPGDEGELQLAKVRLQFAKRFDSPRICQSESGQFVLIGDIDGLYLNGEGGSNGGGSGSGSGGYISGGGGNSTSNRINSGSSTASASAAGSASSIGTIEDIPLSVVALNNVHTIAQVLKMSIRDLPEALVPSSLFADLVDLTRRQGNMRTLDRNWEEHVALKLSTLSLARLSTFTYIIQFLREVAAQSTENAMDLHNLSIVFAPTIFHSETTDPIRAVMEVKLSQVLLEQILRRHNLLYVTIQHFIERAMNAGPAVNANGEDLMAAVLRNPILSAYRPILETDIGDDEQVEGLTTFGSTTDGTEEEVEEGQYMREIASHVQQKRMAGRMAYRGGRNNISTDSYEEQNGLDGLPDEEDLSVVGKKAEADDDNAEDDLANLHEELMTRASFLAREN